MGKNGQPNEGEHELDDNQKHQNSEGEKEKSNTNKNQEQQNSQGGQSNQDQKKKSQNNKQDKTDVGHDTHSLWDKAIEERKKEQQQQEQQNISNSQDKEDNEQQKKSQGGQSKKENQEQQNESEMQSNQSKQQEKKTQSGNEKNQEQQKEQDKNENNKVEEKSKLAQQGEKKTFEQNKIERRKRLQELSEELAKLSSHQAGNEIQRNGKKLSDIGIAAPLIDWRRLLRQAIKHEEEYTRKNTRMRDGFFTHKLEQIPLPETEIVLDTSGSVSEVLLKNFLRECKNILENSKVKVGCFNTEFHGFTEIKKLEDIDNMSFPIGGGTNFNAAVGAFSRRAPNKIIFTDGQAPMPKETARGVIWIVFGDKQINPKGGKVISITGEQLKRLYQSSVKNRNAMSR